MRRFIIDNALMWLRDFHVDALRLDAVHALQSTTPRPTSWPSCRPRPTTLSTIGRPAADPHRRVRPQRPDHDHPAGRRAATGWPRSGTTTSTTRCTPCSPASGRATTATSARCRCWPRRSPRRSCTTARTRRSASRCTARRSTRTTVRGWQFVVCLQNHDQVGNRAVGDRLPELAPTGPGRVGAVLLLTSPFTPMLWMGEEWAAATRWPFFTSHPEPELAEATGQGPARRVRRARLGHRRR